MTSIVFKEFLPDQPELGNPGLVKAQNVLPRDDGYSRFRPFVSGGTLTSGGVAGSFQSFGVTKGASRVYLYSGDFWVGSVSGGFTTRGGAFTVSSSVDVGFAQYENLVIAVGDTFPAHFITVGSATNFATLASSGTAPPAQAIDVLGQFVVIGGLGTANATQRPNVIQWSGVDAPRSWPTPGSATAIAQQAGEQELPSLFGEVHGIHGGDQYALILQKRGITRMTYVGPPAVFQFDTVSNTEGSFFPRGSIRVGGITYFISQQGFCRTNGVTIEHIGAGKVDKFFWDNVSVSELRAVTCSYDPANDLVYFAYPVANTSNPDKLLIFNPKTGNWSHANQELEEFIGGSWATLYTAPLSAFQTSGSASLVGQFYGTSGSAVLETGEMELNEGGRAYVDAIKAHVESSGTAPSIGMRIGTRDDLGTAPSYTSTTGAFARTGFANFRSDAKYHRFEVNITGNFEKVTGIEVNARPSGKA